MPQEQEEKLPEEPLFLAVHHRDTESTQNDPKSGIDKQL